MYTLHKLHAVCWSFLPTNPKRSFFPIFGTHDSSPLHADWSKTILFPTKICEFCIFLYNEVISCLVVLHPTLCCLKNIWVDIAVTTFTAAAILETKSVISSSHSWKSSLISADQFEKYLFTECFAFQATQINNVPFLIVKFWNNCMTSWKKLSSPIGLWIVSTPRLNSDWMRQFVQKRYKYGYRRENCKLELTLQRNCTNASFCQRLWRKIF